MPFFRTRESFFEAAMTGDLYELDAHLKKFSINVADSLGNTALHIAIMFRQGDAIRYLVQKSPDFEAQGKDGLTPLMLAMEKCKPSLIIPIIKAPGSNPNTHDNNYVYPLHKAAATGEMDIVKALVEHGADVNVRTRDTEDTPLHMAIANGRRAVAEYLVHKGARIDIAGKDGKTAQQLAKEAGPKMYAIIDPQSVANDRMREAPMEVWELATPTQVAKISTLPALQRKITEIFNFETRERMTVTRNLKTGAESVGEAEAFAGLAEEAVGLAAQKLKILGGRAPDGTPSPKVGNSPVGNFKI